MRSNWTQRARQQFARQRKYFRKHVSLKLDEFIHVVIDAEQKAAQNPYTYRMIPEEQNELKREILVWNYRLMYWIDESDQIVYITGLYHQRQNYTPDHP